MVKLVVAVIIAVLSVTALVAQDSPESFDTTFQIILDARETDPIEGEMVLATLRGQYRETITNEELKLRPMTDFDWVQLAPDRWSKERIDGLPTDVVERRIAMFPKKAGQLTILPIAHELEVMNRRNERQKILVRSDQVMVNVTPKPAGIGSDWLPAQALEISETWTADPARLVDGQNVERRIVLRALGVPPEVLPKQPPMREPWLITFAPPEERSVQYTTQGPVSTVVWVWKLRPITGEPGVVPSVPIPYFDTTDRQTKSIVIPAANFGYASFTSNDSSAWASGIALNGVVFFGFAAGNFLDPDNPTPRSTLVNKDIRKNQGLVWLAATSLEPSAYGTAR